jgi:hypothetical protein
MPLCLSVLNQNSVPTLLNHCEVSVMTTPNLISRDFHGATIRQRSDGYLNATDMCKATGKLFSGYKRLKSTKEYLDALSSDMQIHTSNIIQVVRGVTKDRTAQEQGTWIHPNASIHLAIWCNSEFAVMVTKWTYELLTKGSVSLDPKLEIATFAQTKANELDKLGIIGNAKQIALNNSIKQQFGCDMLQLFGIASQPAEIQQVLLIPSDIAKRVGLKSARPVNLKLIEFGLQTKHRDRKNRLYYQLTEKGLKHAQYQDVGKKHNLGTPVRAIKWYDSVLQFFQTLTAPKILKLI